MPSDSGIVAAVNPETASGSGTVPARKPGNMLCVQ